MKKENSTLSKKLKQYSAMAVPMLAIAGAANSQVVYTDINPDRILGPADTLNLDLNNDGAIDYVFYVITGNNLTYAGVYPYLNSTAAYNQILGTVLTTGSVKFGFPSQLDAGDVIDGNQPAFGLTDIAFPYNSQYVFFLPPMLSFYGGNTFGQWQGGVTDKYVGFHFTNDGANFFFGWARCDVSQDALQLTVKDYAYETQAETAILAGAGLNIGIPAPATDDGVKIFTFNKLLNVNFRSTNLSDASIRLLNVLGEEIISQKVTTAQNSIDLKGFTAGTYLVVVNYEGKETSRKIVVN